MSTGARLAQTHAERELPRREALPHLVVDRRHLALAAAGLPGPGGGSSSRTCSAQWRASTSSRCRPGRHLARRALEAGLSRSGERRAACEEPRMRQPELGQQLVEALVLVQPPAHLVHRVGVRRHRPRRPAEPGRLDAPRGRVVKVDEVHQHLAGLPLVDARGRGAARPGKVLEDTSCATLSSSRSPIRRTSWSSSTLSRAATPSTRAPRLDSRRALYRHRKGAEPPFRCFLGACRRNPARAMRRVQLRGGARRQPARRTFSYVEPAAEGANEADGPLSSL